MGFVTFTFFEAERGICALAERTVWKRMEQSFLEQS